jgi:hypothetical protein
LLRASRRQAALALVLILAWDARDLASDDHLSDPEIRRLFQEIADLFCN